MERGSTWVGRLALALFLANVPAEACTVFVVSREGAVFAGSNEDWADPGSKVWFVPADGEEFGRVYFGFEVGSPEGGLNDQGLFFDRLMLEGPEDVKRPKRRIHPDNVLDDAMRSCATVVEVVKLFRSYDLGFGDAQVMFGDASGDAVIIERRGIWRKKQDYQIASNYRLSTKLPDDPECPRYVAAAEVLANCGVPAEEAIRTALAASKQDSTAYSLTYDLVNRRVFLYLDHKFRDVVSFDLDAELTRGANEYDLTEYFERRLLRQAAKRTSQ